MYKALKHGLAVVPFLFALASSPSHAWTVKIDCEAGAVGSLAQGASNAFTWAPSKTVYSSEQVGTGSKSCKMGITKGVEGWGEWGATTDFPTKLGKGSELWVRVSVFFPTDFDLTASPWLKFIRVHTATPSNSNQGYLDWYINPPNRTIWSDYAKAQVSDPFTFYYEGRPVPRTFGTTNHKIALGKWETFEIYYKLDTVSTDKGGTGRVRVWKNNELLGDFTDQVTLADDNTVARSLFLFTYWNGNAPKTQSLYVDDVIITTDRPSNRDAKGNPFIGAPVMSGSAPSQAEVLPKPPANLRVIN